MKKKKWQCFTVFALSTAMLIFGSEAYASGQREAEPEMKACAEVRAVGTDEFEIEDKVLKKYTGNASEVVIPKNVEIIGRAAFLGKSSLNSIILPDGVTTIEGHAFEDCSGLEYVEIPDSITTIEDSAFENCGNLTEIKIPRVTVIGERAFYNCKRLANLVLTDVMKIGRAAFDGTLWLEKKRQENPMVIVNDILVDGKLCSGDIEIPGNITKIVEAAFRGGKNITNAAIPKSVTRIERYTFSGCSSLARVDIPKDVSYIGESAFSGCGSLEGIVIPEYVASIGDNVFSDCGSLEHMKVETGNETYDSRENCNAIIETSDNSMISGCNSTIIPESVTRIESGAFRGRSGLTSVVIPESVEYIGTGAFSGCSGLETITVEEGNKRYDSREDCNAIIETVNHCIISGCKNTTFPQSVSCIGEKAFSGCSNLKNMVIPETVTAIGSGAFSGCSSLTSVTVPGSVAVVDASVFSGCSSLTNVEMKHGVTRICWHAFYKCGSLRQVSIPESVTEIEWYSFYECASLKSVTIPETVTSIGGRAFGYYHDDSKVDPDIIIVFDNFDLKYQDIVICGVKGTAAENYAKTNGFEFHSSKDDGTSAESISCKKKIYHVVYGTKPFQINAVSNGKLAFTSSDKKVAVVNKNTGKVTVKGTGIAYITVRTGTKSEKVTVKVRPKKQILKNLKALPGRKLKVSWKKDSQATGYEIQYSMDKKFKKKVTKSASIKKNKTTSITLKKLSKGKKYYVRIRAYKSAKANGKLETLYSGWTNAKKVTIK